MYTLDPLPRSSFGGMQRDRDTSKYHLDKWSYRTDASKVRSHAPSLFSSVDFPYCHQTQLGGCVQQTLHRKTTSMNPTIELINRKCHLMPPSTFPSRSHIPPHKSIDTQESPREKRTGEIELTRKILRVPLGKFLDSTNKVDLLLYLRLQYIIRRYEMISLPLLLTSQSEEIAHVKETSKRPTRPPS